MQFKVFVTPTIIIMTLVLAIWFIKPDLEVLQTKKADILTRQAMAENVDMTIANISALNGSLDTQQDFEKFAYRYLPNTQNQEQVIDAFNFLAVQSGVVISEMELKQSPDQGAASGRASEEISDVFQKAALPAVKIFTFSGSVVGSYENIKKFFDRFAHIGRFQKIKFFSIAIGTASPPDINYLSGRFDAEFGYLSPQAVGSALDMPIFLHSKFDFSNVEKLLQRTESAIPPLEKGQTGKPNPFE